MNDLNCQIIDDEELAITLLENYIGRLPNLKLIGAYSNPIEALQLLQNQSIDLIFLDIQMPEINGTDFLKTLAQKPMVVFTTAYSEHAIEGCELNIVDYLLKPFSFERFVQAINKASTLAQLRTQSKAGNPLSTDPPMEDKKYILVKSEHKVHRIRYDDINYIQSMREYVAYYTPSGRILSLSSLKKLETDLPENKFIRIHKSFIISKSKVSTLEGNMVHINKEKIPIGASYREEVLKSLF
ncbi:MAG: DNA-binding LytR/AlgR family response regulator [Saprospiraceae bacterium]|jgi:DNA-binding LytR/AlgR family response regulator